ncbi:YfjP family GTPase [Actinorugispora endophytica]|uniref:50S ribosome-binding GTPase n=1 Tax=Actinorugispora endophytica TaxID=1605990 RepID=A0A4R6UNQ4_9ACTN|nr:YfjP family GTPase [Actinorugispora endophytica]TDQ48770.1 50S ribosome-binding GTPase [Actinorugispora endophytica]
MTTPRNFAHAEHAPDTARPEAVPAVPPPGQGWRQDRTAPPGQPPQDPTGQDTDSYPELRRAADAHSGPQPALDDARPPAAFSYRIPGVTTAEPAPERPRENGFVQEPQTEPARPPSGGRHAAPRAAPAAPTEGGEETASDDGPDPDDPDNLAGWVGSLADAVDAVDEDDAATGRRADPVPEPAADVPEAMEPAGAGKAGAEAAEPEADEPDWSPSSGTDDDDEEEYQPTRREIWQPMPATTRAELISRLDALAVLVELGRDHFAPELIARARGLLTHAGARLRLSADHTVIALAGGTGSGKSSLFNALSGLELSRVGITRPTTSSAHACVWGLEGADGLLDWLGVPPRHRHSRASELDKGDSDLTGLILLDLPDHDSVRAVHTAESDHLIGTADLLVWVLDPQKYADAAVHHRYLAEMAGHGAVTVAVLNQVDRVGPEEVEELLTDLRRLLETESGAQPRVLTSSAVTGHGLRDLRELLVETVAERRASIDRLVADLEQVVADFEEYGAPDAAAELPPSARKRLVERLAEASGVEAIADATETAHERHGARVVDWPVTRWLRRLRRDPLRAVQLDFLHEGLPQGGGGPIGAQRAEIDTAVIEAADSAAGSLPDPWPKRVRAAGRSNLETLSDELGAAIADTIPDEKVAPSWWRAARAAQYLLVAAAGIGLAWLAVLLVSWIGGGITGVPALDTPLFMAFAAALAASSLLLGWLTGVGCRNLVSVEAARRREQVDGQGTGRVERIAVERVVAPLEDELQKYGRYCQALARTRRSEQG